MRAGTKMAAIVNLHNEGKSLSEITKITGIKKSLVSCKLSVARKMGYIGEHQSTAFMALKYRKQRKQSEIGGMYDLLHSLPAEVGRWLDDITPEGAKVYETIGAIVKDAYAEENEDCRTHG